MTKILLILLSLSITKGEKLDSNDTACHITPCCRPEQIHLAFGEKINDIVLTWSTFNFTDSYVLFGVEIMSEETIGFAKLFTDSGKLKRKQWIHRVTLKDLLSDTTYKYRVGSKCGLSDTFSFKTPPVGENWVVKFGVYGDMGYTNAQALPYVRNEAENGNFDFVLHVGDFAYNLDDHNALVGDHFMRQIQPLAAIVPYMTSPGNHEEKYNFSNYKNRFSMPGPYENMFYSFDIGPVHFICICTEFYYFVNYGFHMVAYQYDWFVKELEVANHGENKQKRPWIIVYGHRPMYCSNSDDPECLYEYTRTGIPFLGKYGLEPLLKKYKVDLVIWAHEHSYERTWPLYNQKVYNGSFERPYWNPTAPVHLITGSAGCQSGRDPFKRKPAMWSAFRSEDYGYTKIKVFNKSHINLVQVSVDLDGQVVDEFWLVKTEKTK